MSAFSISHPTDRPNFTQLTVPGATFWFSYTTIVAYQAGGSIRVCENNWTQTTGKHLNWLQEDKKKRVPWAQFQTELTALSDVLYGAIANAVDVALGNVEAPLTPEEITAAIERLQSLLKEASVG